MAQFTFSLQSGDRKYRCLDFRYGITADRSEFEMGSQALSLELHPVQSLRQKFRKRWQALD